MNNWTTKVEEGHFICNCPYFFHRKKDCKHIKALKIQMGLDVEIGEDYQPPQQKSKPLKISLENFQAL